MKVDFELEKEICRAAEEICYEELRSIEDELERQGRPVFSDEYNKKISKTIYGYVEREKKGFLKKEFKVRKIKYRYILLVAILLILCTSTVMAVEPVREKLRVVIYSVFSNNVEIGKDDNAESLENVKEENMIIKTPVYVPEGYKKYEESIQKKMQKISITWMSEDEKLLYYSQFNVNNVISSITSDGSAVEVVDVNNHEGRLVVDENGIYTLFYEDQEYVYMISGELVLEELVKILGSIE